MYKANFKIQSECLNKDTNKIFVPFVNCYYIHSITLLVNGSSNYEYDNFDVIDNYLYIEDYILDGQDDFRIEINYFYIKKDNYKIFDFMIDKSYDSENLKIISKHYIEWQFSLDNWLYKNAVLNFGTVIEWLLNKNLEYKYLDDLIKDSQSIRDLKQLGFILNS